VVTTNFGIKLLKDEKMFEGVVVTALFTDPQLKRATQTKKALKTS
jgi:hypothetical protein